jgi:hypothetical protein
MIMKNIFKYTFAVLLGAMAAVSCTNEYEYDAPSATEQGGNATISASQTTFVYVPGQEQACNITVARIDSTQAQTISLTCDNTKFSVPSSVSFAAGERTKEVAVTSNVESGGSEVANIAIGSEDAFIYGANAVQLTVNVYRSFAGVYASSFYSAQWDIVIYELAKGSYLIPDAYADGYDFAFTIDFNSNSVSVPNQFIDTYGDYGRIRFTAAKGTYDPENKLVTVTTQMTLPDTGYSFNGNPTEYIMFIDDPQQ